MLASKSMISFIVLIFSAYCCALPVQDELLTSTSRTFDMDWTTAEMIIKKEQRSEMPVSSLTRQAEGRVSQVQGDLFS
jgi:hypothetical protein